MMLGSAVPLPLASRPRWCGDHASARTAALCLVIFATGMWDRELQRTRLLSLPPLASWVPSGDHFSPHTSCLCYVSLTIESFFALRSRCIICRSRPPDESILSFHANVPTRPLCGVLVEIGFDVSTSYIITRPALFATDRRFPVGFHATEVAF